MSEGRNLILTQRDVQNFRACLAEVKDVPYTFALHRETYNNYWNRKFRHLIPHNYVGVLEKHKDTYVHCTTIENAKKILAEGVLRCGGRDVCTIGNAVYSFPLGSGRHFNFDNLVAIVFTADAEHVHLVDDGDSSCVIGEADFLQDVRISDAKIVTQEELNVLAENAWDAKSCLYKYYGVKDSEITQSFHEITREQLPDFVDSFIVQASFWEDTDDIRSKMEEYAESMEISYENLCNLIYNSMPALLRKDDKLESVESYWNKWKEIQDMLK